MALDAQASAVLRLVLKHALGWKKYCRDSPCVRDEAGFTRTLFREPSGLLASDRERPFLKEYLKRDS